MNQNGNCLKEFSIFVWKQGTTMVKEKIFVTKTYLPPIDLYTGYLKKIWKNNWITNHGQFSLQLEKRLKNFLGVKNLILVSNGTVALEIAIKALGIKKEIITTPFSYVATTSSIVWTNCKPVFADIDPKTLCINPELIEKLITKKTQAILATHVYGNPCDVEAIGKIAKKYNLKVIYDAAHCFGVKYKGKSILSYGDISTLSFHATKLFHTAEGGALVTANKENAHKISYSRNFGHKGEEAFWGLGINGKISELHSAMGLCMLPYIKKNITERKKLSDAYDKFLKGLQLQKPVREKETEYNYSYYPVIFFSEEKLLKVRYALNKNGIFPRRYFYPPLNKLNYVEKYSVAAAEDISKRIMCLPLYHGLILKTVKKIAEIISDNI
jgi:dTDP-4-amino-4,6-dideoxygalactose transaminase